MSEKAKQIRKLWVDALEKNTSVLKEEYKPEQECYLCHEDSVPFIRFHAFDAYKEVNAGFSTRFGGESTGYLAELNLGFERGDSDDTVARNFKSICESMGIQAQNLVLSDQIHKTEVRYVTKKDTCQERIGKKLRGIDGLITDQRDVSLATSYADCVPVFFYDPVKHIIAASHSGWRGTVDKIATKTIEKMAELFGSCAEDIVVVIGPSICQSCYEVSYDVIEAFQKKYTPEQVKQIAWCSDSSNQKYQLDLWAANVIQLQESGVKKENIHVAGLCTCCNHELLYSHRASKGKRGNLNGFITLVK